VQDDFVIIGAVASLTKRPADVRFGSKAVIDRRLGDVRLVPIADSTVVGQTERGRSLSSLYTN